MDVLTALDEAVKQGTALSKNALVERALVREIRELQRQYRQARWEEAGRDPLFRQDLAESEQTRLCLPSGTRLAVGHARSLL